MPKPVPQPKPLNLRGTASDDTLQGGILGDTINGAKGNDTLIGNGGADQLTGGLGADTFKYLAFSDGGDHITDFNAAQGDIVDLTALGTATLQSSYNAGFSGLQAVLSYDAGLNRTTLFYYNGTSTPVFQIEFVGNVSYSPNAFLGIVLGPTQGDDNLVGTADNDTIDLLGGNDTYSGLAGNDLITGGDGADTMSGGEGEDTFVYLSGGSGVDTVSGDDGIDTLDFRNYNNPATPEQGMFTVGDNYIFDRNGATILTFSGIEQIYGSAFNDLLRFGDLTTNLTLWGMAGDDSIGGGQGNDIIYGGEGNDSLFDYGGNDILDGGEGNDFLDAGTGNDVVRGDAGDDTIRLTSWTSGETKYLDGGTGFDTLNFSSLNVGISMSSAGLAKFEPGNYEYFGYAPNFEYVYGTAFNDEIVFTDSYQGVTIEGQAGNDYLFGSRGDDEILGGSGNDNISGSYGIDVLRGDSGADLFWLVDSGDRIADFSTAQGDKLYLLEVLYDADGQQFDGGPTQSWMFVDGAYRDDLSANGQIVLSTNALGYALTFYYAGDSTPDAVTYINAAVTVDDFVHQVIAAPPEPTLDAFYLI